MSQKLYLDFFESLGQEILGLVYGHSPLNCKLIFRLLPSHAQLIIQRLLLIKDAVPFSEIRSWVPSSERTAQNKSLWKLKQLHIIQGKQQEVWLNDAFRQNFLQAISGFLTIPEIKKYEKIELAETHFQKKWNGILYCIVTGGGSHSQYSAVGKSVHDLLLGAGLITREGSQLTITNQGFQFLLADAMEQLATLSIQYCSSFMEQREELLEAISVLSFLAFSKSESLYLLKDFSKGQQTHLKALDSLGLVFFPPQNKSSFCPTNLCKFISFVGDAPVALIKSEGFIIIETNYKIYAYTNSPLHLSILSLFIRIKTRFSNMIHGTLKQDTVQDAFKRGITASQIIKFITTHCHPIMRSQNPIIPPTIIDQINLWELDRNRLKAKEGFMYQQFMNSADFEKTVAEANRLNAVLYAHPGKRLLIVSVEGHGQIKNFVKNNL